MSPDYGVWIDLRYDFNESRDGWETEIHRAPGLPIPHQGDRVWLADGRDLMVERVLIRYPSWGAMEPTVMVLVDLAAAEPESETP